MLLHWWNPNSAYTLYTQLSGERYRTNGPLVLYFRNILPLYQTILGPMFLRYVEMMRAKPEFTGKIWQPIRFVKLFWFFFFRLIPNFLYNGSTVIRYLWASQDPWNACGIRMLQFMSHKNVIFFLPSMSKCTSLYSHFWLHLVICPIKITVWAIY